MKIVLTLNRSRSTHRVDALDELLATTDDVPDAWGDAGHDAHAEDHVAEVGDLHADLGQRAAHGTHAERDDVHVAALHAAGEAVTHLLGRLLFAHPLAEDAFLALSNMGDALVLVVGDDEGLALHTGNISWIRAAEIAVTHKEYRKYGKKAKM